MTPQERTTFTRSLLRWYEGHKRSFPWRQEATPYRVWISEVMLQQTQSERVVDFFLNWVSRFPDIRSVAEAEEDDLLKAWEGLGYYSRARRIQAAAQEVMRKHEGMLPQDHEQLLKLPGIGPYTAAAIMSLAFNQPYPVVDGNVERVFARVLNIASPVKNRAAHDLIKQTALSMMPAEDPSSFNQALMELGATICQPRRPDCFSCPVQGLCQSLEQGVVLDRPVPGKQPAITAIQVAAGVLVAGSEIFIQKRPPHGLMANLWEFPGGKLNNGEGPEQALVREFKEELELDVEVGEKITVIKHGYTTFRVTLHVYWCRLVDVHQQPVLRAATESAWVEAGDLDRYAFPAADRKLITMLAETFTWGASL
jgi:A/G-specific adenine glycosylase